MSTAEVSVIWPSHRSVAPGAVLALEIIDEGSRPCRTLALSPDQPQLVALPHPGSYLARGWLPNGTEFNGTFHSGAGEVRVSAVGAAPPVAPTAPAAANAFRLWAPHRRGWTPISDRMPMPPRPGGDDVGSGGGITIAEVGRPAGRAVAVEFEFDPDTRCTRIAAPGMTVAPSGLGPAGTTAMHLLAYLHVGDLRSARIVAAAVEAGPVARPTDPLMRVALAYLWLQSADPRFHQWGRHLDAEQVTSPDAAVLAGWARLTDPDGPAAEPHFREVLDLGLPLVAAGVRLLADGLLATAGRSGGTDLARVRRCCDTLRDEVFTTYPGSPDTPSRRSASAAAVRLAAGAVAADAAGAFNEVVALFRLPLLGLRAAGDGDAPDNGWWTHDDLGLTLATNQIGPDAVSLDLRVDPARLPPDPVLELDLTSAGQTRRYLVPVGGDHDHLVGHLMIRGVREYLDIAVRAPRVASSLGPEDLPAIRRSVPATDRTGRNQWRTLARTRPERHDPVRQTIVESLS